MPSKFRLIRWIIFVIAAGSLVLTAFQRVQASAEVERFERLSVEQGLSQSWVRAILQDQQGYMWFGTEDGLNRFDGYEFTIYKHDLNDPTSLADSNVTALLQDAQGRLWVGTLNGVDRLDSETGTFIHYRTVLDDGSTPGGMEISALYQDRAGFIWVGSEDGGLSRYNAASDSFTRFQYDPADPGSLSDDRVLSIYEDRQGVLWVGTAAGGLNAFDRQAQKFTHYRAIPANPVGLSSDAVRAIFEDSQGNLWVGTDTGGLNLFNRSSQTFKHYRNEIDNPFSLSSDEVRVIYEDNSGELWVGTRAGLNRFNRSTNSFVQYRYDASDIYSIGSDSIWSLYQDGGGILWVGTGGGGVSKYAGSLQKFKLFQHRPNRPETLSDNNVLAITQDKAENLWVGTQFGGLNRLDRNDNVVDVFRHDPRDPTSIAGDDVRALLVDSTGKLWVGLNRGGLDTYDPLTKTFIHMGDSRDVATGLAEDRVAALYEDRSGEVWVGLWTMGLDRWHRESDTFVHYRHEGGNANSLVDDRVRVIYQDRQGLLWIGTYGGFSIFDPVHNSFVNFSNDPNDSNSLSNDVVRSFYEDEYGNMWVATYGGGLNYFNREQQTFTRYTNRDGLPNNALFGILPDARGHLWISTNSGLSRFDPRRETFRNYSAKDGLQGDEFNSGAFYLSPQGEMFFGGTNGLNAFFPEQVVDNANVPPVVVTAFRKFNNVVKTDLRSGDSIELSYTDNFISFDFAALDYYAPQRNQYSYMLEGFDRQWVDAGTRRYASYTNLQGGDYVFRVRGSNSDGIWNVEGFSVNIHVTPPIWGTWWFFGAVAVLLAGLIFGGYRMRVEDIKERNRSLEVEVRRRTRDLERRQQVAEGLRKILNMLNSNYSLGDSLDTILEQAGRLSGACCAYIYQTTESGDPIVLALQEQHGSPEGALLDWKAFIGEGVISSLARNEAVTLSNLKTSHGEGGIAALPFNDNHSAILAMPLPVTGPVNGGLVLLFENHHAFKDEEVHLASTLADQASLAIANAQLRAQAEQSAVAAERSRLARDLHDAVTQTLFTTSLIADVLPRIWERNPEEGKARLEQIRQLTRGALAEMRTLLLELRPATLTETNLGDLIRQLCLAFTGRTQIPVDVSVEGDFVLPPDVQVGFYRIAQELLNNVAKHAQASNVTVRLSEVAGQILLRVCDDGRGFDLESVPSGHMGLGIIRERAAAIGAMLDVDSRPGGGTVAGVFWSGDITDSEE